MMAEITKKRTLDAFFRPPAKKTRISGNEEAEKETNSAGEDHVRRPVALHVQSLTDIIQDRRLLTPFDISNSDTMFSKIYWR